MQAIKEFIGGIVSIVLVIGLWGIGCMLGVVPFLIGIYLWNKVL